MNRAWKDLWPNSRKWLKTGWLITAGIIAIYVGGITPLRDIQTQRVSESVQFEPISLWRAHSFSMARQARYTEGIIGGGGGGGADKIQLSTMAMNAAPASRPEDRRLVRTCTMDLIVQVPKEAAEKIRQLAENMGGYLEKLQVNGSQSRGNASLTVHVPASRMEEARAEIRKLGLRVETEQLEAQDVTKDYVDREAHLRNLHAQEEQYLAIMKRATTVKDTLEVSEQLDNVRGQIEQEQAEFNALAKQVETVAITVSLTTEADAQVFGISWRPLFRLKMAARDGLDGLGEYFASIAQFLFFLPTILLWLATILIGAALGWRILKWAARVLFVPRKQVLAERTDG